jgi:glutathione synthase/RimK-type ligase-like ATP-grasp enzyme
VPFELPTVGAAAGAVWEEGAMRGDDIVIVSSAHDHHVDDMVLQLHKMGHEPIRLDTEDVPLRTTLCLRFPSQATRWACGIALASDGRMIDIDTVRSIWWRRPREYFGLPAELSEQEREFARSEIDHALRGIWPLIDCYWVSNPEHIRQAGSKIEQLQRAAQYGFEVPPTLVTNDPAEVRAFYDACAGQMIFKVLTDPSLGMMKVAAKHPNEPLPELRETKTTLITATELEQLESVRLVPCLFQAYVPKRAELRVTVIGDDLFVAEIDSQSRESTAVDWRNWSDGGFDIPYRVATLPIEVAERCMALVRSYGLNFSALDLIHTPDDRYVFLENNPNGQFMWIEKRLPELEMTAALASCLVRGSSS